MMLVLFFFEIYQKMMPYSLKFSRKNNKQFVLIQTKTQKDLCFVFILMYF